ncbi:MAG TPA: enoyl-CoA hydratase/isomerase family protein [Candidatus Avacidaminococcus intestinavium]|uniref:Enoyl-CoA hydratase/isomerase family protein n=1 Tax=Candidatus Avacidaminococcus intestinavium TaxID=2840684 RepID=A0A9D1MP50_9FIRM|nr:enoyl-CoA hydratase/isomerase family protein [Candidatus Avacidaminococcus intestinavium]
MYNNITFVNEDGIGILTINRPKVLNALNQATMLEIEQVLTDIKADDTLKALIITGAGEKSFVAGADIAEMSSLSAIEGRAWAQLSQAVFAKIENLPLPVIGAINGFALGGGCELAMACDIRIAAVNAKFAQPEVSLGITAGFGGTQRLPRLVGKGRAKEMLFTGAMIDAAEAYRIGLVNEVVEAEQLMEAAHKMVAKITKNAPLAVRLTKDAVNTGIELDLTSAIAYEAEVFGLCFATEDQKEGMAAFLGKRNAEFKAK